MICLVSFVLVLSLVGDVSAATVIWTDSGPDHLWSTAQNWDTGTVPITGDKVDIVMLPGRICSISSGNRPNLPSLQ